MKCKHCKTRINDKEAFVIVKSSRVHKKCMDDFINKHIIKSKLTRQKERSEMKDYKKSVKKTRSIVSTQKLFNTYIRWRDTRPSGNAQCISCSKIVTFGESTCHAGHYHSVGARSDLRFNEDNVHAQCMHCNNFQEASKVGTTFKDNLIYKIGKKRFKALDTRIKQDYSEKALSKLRKKLRNKMNE